MAGILDSQPSAAIEPQLRELWDAPKARANIYQNVLTNLQSFEPVENQLHRLELADVQYADPDVIPRKRAKQAILRGETLDRRVRGTWRLVDKQTNQVIDQRKATVARVPHLTDDGTYIINGTQYSLANQMRLLPGAFARRKENGELEGHINILPGTGISHRIQMDPEKGVFQVEVSQAHVPLITLLRALGTSDKELREAWGNLYAANAKADKPAAMDRIYTHFLGNKPVDVAEQPARLKEIVEKMRLDPDVMQRTLGRPDTNLGVPTYLAMSKKLLAIQEGKQEPDDRDHPANQMFMGPEDLIAERVRSARSSLRPLLWRISARKSLAPMQSGFMTRHLQAAITASGLGQPVEGSNPLDAWDQMSRTSRMGFGGIPSLDAIPDESRDVQAGQFGFIDVLRSPESEQVGVDMRAAANMRRGPGGKMYAPVIDQKTGKQSWMTPQEVAAKVLALPGEMERGRPYVSAVDRGKMRLVPRERVELTMPHAEGTFSPLANLVPFKSAIYGQRAVMASRMLAQALPLVGAEAQLVQTGVPGKPGSSYAQLYGRHLGAIHADKDGTVVSADPDSISVKFHDGKTQSFELANYYPNNRRTFWHHRQMVKPGQTFQKGDLLAASNFTDDQGQVALGKNLRAVYLPFRGLNYEDSIGISQSTANAMRSSHLYQHEQEWDDAAKKGLKSFVSIFPAEYDRKLLSQMDEKGVVKPGTKVRHGDPLVLVARERPRTHHQVTRAKSASHVNASLTWDHEDEGTVRDVEHTPKGVVLTIESESGMQDADKLSGLYGDKGTVRIIPDDEMPHDKNGKPFDVILNPYGIQSRRNPTQVYEASLGKIAAKTGKPYRVEDFGDIADLAEYTRRELAKHNLSAKETVIDPRTGRSIPNVFTGMRYMMKLHHMAEHKAQGRGTGAYTAEGVPAKTEGGDNPKKLAIMDSNAILSHGAYAVLRDRSLRGQRNLDYLSAFVTGRALPAPEVAHNYYKFFNHLRGIGINPVRRGQRIHLMALTNDDVDQYAGDRNLQNSDTVDWKSGLKGMPGGLFDPKLTGGHGGKIWSAIALHEPMPSPAFEEPIRALLGLTAKKFEDVLAGRDKIGDDTGPAAIGKALDRIDLKRDISQAELAIRSGRKGARDTAIKKLKYLKGLEATDRHPRDWMLKRVPVLPAAFRPVSVMGSKKLPLVSNPNYLYKELMDANQNLAEMSTRVDDIGEERLAVYNAFKGVTGLGDPITPKNQEKNVKGLLKYVLGSSPKWGSMQSKLLAGHVDMVGRAVLSPDADLDIDQAGIPETKAWNIYRPFVARKLTQRGASPMDAAREVEKKSDVAKRALLDVMDERPVVITRAPVLHRYGTMAFRPVLVKGNSMRLPPLVFKGFGADNDGDMLNFHVMGSEEASKEAIERMLPSRNLLSTKDFKAHQIPTQEFLGGLYTATYAMNKKQHPQIFATAADAIRAYRRGDIDVNTPVEIHEHEGADTK